MKLTLGRAVVGATAVALCLASPVITTAADASGAHARAGTVGSPRVLTGAITLGQTAGVGALSCGASSTTVQYVSGAASYQVPEAGVITSFSYYANNPGQVRAVLVGPSAVADHRTVVATSALQTVAAGSVNTFPTRIAAPAGAGLGIYNTQNDMACFAAGTPAEVIRTKLGFDPATTSDFSGTELPAARANISAVLEPDVDHDGFGDVSQDACPQSAKTQVACPAPDTTVTKKPKRSSSKRKVKIVFSSMAGATFTCTVDKKAAKPCSSPFKARLKYGKHTVLITATSPVGIVEAVPASVKFKIRRPR
jgi:hypothetical protein